MSSVATRPCPTSAVTDVKINERSELAKAEPRIFYCAAIHLAVLFIFREVVDVCRMNHSVRSSRSAAQTLEIVERTTMHIGAYRGERLGTCVRTSETGTWCPASINSRTIAEPMNPVAPVTKTHMLNFLLRFLFGYDDEVDSQAAKGPRLSRAGNG